MLHLCARIFVILDILRRKEGSEGSIGRHQMRVGLKHAPVPVLVTVAFDGGPRCVRPPCHPLIVESPFGHRRSEEHTSELQSLMRISYAVFCLKKKTTTKD